MNKLLEYIKLLEDVNEKYVNNLITLNRIYGDQFTYTNPDTAYNNIVLGGDLEARDLAEYYFKSYYKNLGVISILKILLGC